MGLIAIRTAAEVPGRGEHPTSLVTDIREGGCRRGDRPVAIPSMHDMPEPLASAHA